MSFLHKCWHFRQIFKAERIQRLLKKQKKKMSSVAALVTFRVCRRRRISDDWKECARKLSHGRFYLKNEKREKSKRRESYTLINSWNRAREKLFPLPFQTPSEVCVLLLFGIESYRGYFKGRRIGDILKIEMIDVLTTGGSRRRKSPFQLTVEHVDLDSFKLVTTLSRSSVGTSLSRPSPDTLRKQE